MLQIYNVDYIYPSGKQALSGINLSIERGEFAAIAGQNGSGKSTLALLIAGLEKPTRGNIIIDGINTRDKKKSHLLRQKIGIVFQNPENQIVFEKVKDDIAFGLKNFGLSETEIKKRVEEIICKMNIENFTDSFELSMGQKQRAAIAGVLALEPECIIFDEPTAMLDPKSKKEIHDIIVALHKQGMTIVYITNVIDEVLSADKLIVMENASIKCQYKRAEIFDNVENLKSAHLEMPVIMELLFRLKMRGINIVVKRWAVEDVVDKIVEYLKPQ